MKNKTWSRTPKHILRTDCIQQAVKSLSPGHFVEFGSGTGDLTSLFLDLGYEGTCYDIGKQNRVILRENLKHYLFNINIVDSLNDISPSKYSYLFAFEVLEHIENDLEALQLWTNFLIPGGTVVASVPAHQSKYSSEDINVGHIRRYEKQELISLFQNAGYENIKIINYGFPLGNFTRIISKLIASKNKSNTTDSPLERSIKSGTQRLPLVNKLSTLFNKTTLYPFIILQRAFFNKDLGDGYVITASKKSQ